MQLGESERGKARARVIILYLVRCCGSTHRIACVWESAVPLLVCRCVGGAHLASGLLVGQALVRTRPRIWQRVACDEMPRSLSRLGAVDEVWINTPGSLLVVPRPTSALSGAELLTPPHHLRRSSPLLFPDTRYVQLPFLCLTAYSFCCSVSLQVPLERHKLRQRQHVPPPRAEVRGALRGRQSQLRVCTLHSHEANPQVKHGLGKRGVSASLAKRVNADLEANISFALVSVGSRTHRAYDYSVSRLYTLSLV